MDAVKFKTIILSHYATMYRVAFSIVKNSDDAQDITQDTVARLWEKRDSLNNIDNIAAFCATTAKRQSIDFIRKNNTNPSLPIDEQLALISDYSIDDYFENKERLQQVNNLIKRLPYNQQLVLKLRGIGDHSIEEIGQITGWSNTNVRAMLSRARRKLKELYLNSKK